MELQFDPDASQRTLVSAFGGGSIARNLMSQGCIGKGSARASFLRRQVDRILSTLTGIR